MRKVLIIEDQPALRKLIRTTLEFEAFELHEAADGTQGLHLAMQLRPDLVLLDVMMPGDLDGYLVCEKIKATPQLKHTKVVFLTARAQKADLAEGNRVGCDAYLVKPFSPLKLILLCEQLLKASAPI